MTQEALKLALEALEDRVSLMKWQKARDAVKEALAQPEQEPVAFVKGCNRGQWEIFPAKAHQILGIEQPLYTTPPQRTWERPWVSLTDEEKQEWIDAMPYDPQPRHCMTLVNIIESKLKEKNT